MSSRRNEGYANLVRVQKARHAASAKKYKASPSRCALSTCKKLLPYEKRRNRFCSHSCAACFNNMGNRRHGQAKVEKLCEGCGVNKTFRKFCSNQCQADYNWEKQKEEISRTERTNSSKIARRYLIELYGYLCQRCELKTWQGSPIPLVLDHIDGNYQNGELLNLRLLCCNCDALTPTNTEDVDEQLLALIRRAHELRFGSDDTVYEYCLRRLRAHRKSGKISLDEFENMRVRLMRIIWPEYKSGDKAKAYAKPN